MNERVCATARQICRTIGHATITLSPYIICSGILLTLVSVFSRRFYWNVAWNAQREIWLFNLFPVSRQILLAAGLLLASFGAAVKFRTAWQRRRMLLRLAVLGLAETSFLAGLIFLLLWFYNLELGSVPAIGGGSLLTGKTTDRFLVLDLFPYEGWHVQGNFHQIGPTYLDGAERFYDVRSGPMGFFTSINVAEPPPKQPNEFRIILIGGSGAQGFGASSNQCMMYFLLERMLNERLSTNENSAHVSVINLAMGASVTYQNYICLNRWGHGLEPDLILSYSGRNDYAVPVMPQSLSDGHYHFQELSGLAMASRADEVPPGFRQFNRWFPNILNYTAFGQALKLSFGSDFYNRRAEEAYRASRGMYFASKKDTFEKIAKPRYVHALKSIKRDFGGIPIVLTWQAVGRGEVAASVDSLGPDFYNQMFEESRQALEPYYNDQWYFLNLHQMVEDRSDGSFETHLDDRAQKVVATIISEFLTPIVSELLEKRMPVSRTHTDN